MTTTLERPLTRPGRSHLLRNLGPHWFAAVMGTGIVATAATSLPHQVLGLHAFALCTWGLASVMLVALSVATVAHWILHPVQARAHLSDRVLAHFYGAPPMAVLTVGAGTLLLGRDLLGLHAALVIDWTLWIAGTLAGLVCACLVPYVAFTRHSNGPDAAFGGWLMPVVPPMVSATTGALLAQHLAPGHLRGTLVVLCYGMFALSLAAGLVVSGLVLRRLSRHGIGAAAAVPTLWILLGPLGQSIAAAHGLALVVPTRLAVQAGDFGVGYGVVVLGLALLWLAIVTRLTLRTARAGLPFTLSWWSFTFPVGTVVLGLSALAARTGLGVFAWAATVLYGLLVAAWAVVLVRTATNGRRLLG